MIAEWLKSRAGGSFRLCTISVSRAHYGTRALLLDGGKTLSYGSTGEVFTAENLNRAYHMDVPAWMRGMLAQWQQPEKQG